MNILTTKHLTKQYGTEPNIVKALDDVSISIEQGEFIAVIGTSGSGKSTLLNMLGGLDRPSSGSVKVDNFELGKLKEEDLTVFRRQRIGFIFQNYNLVPILNVYENIVMPIQLDGKEPDEKFIREVVSLLGLEKKLYNMPNTLSGGQQQRVAIARALAGKPAGIAGKVSPMEALRYTDAGTESRRKVKKSTGGAKIYRMALANLERNKKRTFTAICSLTLGLILLSVVYAKNASFDIDKYMSQMVVSDFEVKDSSIATNFSVYNPYGTTVSKELTERIDSLDGLESVGRLYSQVFRHPIGESALHNIQTYYQAGERLSYIEATDPGLARSYYDMVEEKECMSILYGIDGLILDTFSENYRILDGTFDREAFQTGSYILVEAAAEDFL